MRRPWPFVTSPLRLLTVIGARQPVALMIEARSLICSGGCWFGFFGFGRRSLIGTMASWAQNTGTPSAYAFGSAVVMYSDSSGPSCGCGLFFAMFASFQPSAPSAEVAGDSRVLDADGRPVDAPRHLHRFYFSRSEAFGADVPGCDAGVYDDLIHGLGLLS